MKRTRELEIAEMATCLMLLSRVGEIDAKRSGAGSVTSGSGRVFSCKTCNRQFASFQALGGHRTSHKKARIAEGEEGGDSDRDRSPAGKAKAHECSICGVEFAIGQALGGHMRRHRNAAVSASKDSSTETSRDRELVVVEESSGTRDVCLDLKLGSHHEIDLNLRLGLVL